MQHAVITVTDGFNFLTESKFESLADAYEQLSNAEMATGWELNGLRVVRRCALALKNVEIYTIHLNDIEWYEFPKLTDSAVVNAAIGADPINQRAAMGMERVKPETQGSGYSGTHTSNLPW